MFRTGILCKARCRLGPSQRTNTRRSGRRAYVCDVFYSVYCCVYGINRSNTTCHGCKPGRHFLLSCSEVNSKGFSELDEPISARV